MIFFNDSLFQIIRCAIFFPRLFDNTDFYKLFVNESKTNFCDKISRLDIHSFFEFLAEEYRTNELSELIDF